MTSADIVADVKSKFFEEARRALHRKLEGGVRAAFAEGKDFVHLPMKITGPDPFEPFNIMEPGKYTVEVKGGPVAPGLDWPRDYTVYRVTGITEGERARLRDGRDDWRENDWEDDCGIPGCTICYGLQP